jgi:DNA repair exonuclease SbcCD ATPase subunit
MEEETKQEQGGTEPTAKTYTEAEYNALQEQLTAMQSQLSTANETIQSYKDMDIDGIQASVAEYKQKWEQSEADRKAFEYQTRLGQYVKTLGLRDDIYEQHVANLLAGKNLQSSYFCATSSQSARNRYSDNNFPRMP